VNRQ